MAGVSKLPPRCRKRPVSRTMMTSPSPRKSLECPPKSAGVVPTSDFVDATTTTRAATGRLQWAHQPTAHFPTSPPQRAPTPPFRTKAVPMELPRAHTMLHHLVRVLLVLILRAHRLVSNCSRPRRRTRLLISPHRPYRDKVASHLVEGSRHPALVLVLRAFTLLRVR